MKKPEQRHHRKRQRGVAIIEVLIAVLLFSLGILGLIGLQARALSFSIDAEDRNRASLLANDVASTMWLKRSVTLTTAELDAWKARVAASTEHGLPGGSGDVTGVSGTTNAADITISWHRPSRAGTEQNSNFTTRVTLP